MGFHLDRGRPPLGAIEPGVEVAGEVATPLHLGPVAWFFVAVAAGITTWFLTRMLERSSRR